MLSTVVVLLVASIWVVWEIRKAPEGYEDAEGFHYGPQPNEEEVHPRQSQPAQALRPTD